MEEKIKELESSNKKLSDDNSKLNETIKSLSEKNALVEKENKELKEKIALSDKENSFNKLLEEGKAVPAQKEAYLSNDLNKFAELAVDKKPNFEEKGSGKAPKDGEKTLSEDDLNASAEKYALENKVELGEAISILLETPEFAHLNK